MTACLKPGQVEKGRVSVLRLVEYLKPFVLPILAAMVLLYIQANCDLALPDYMSRIVNVGIQQGGVENAVPAAIRESSMNKLTLFMSPDQKADVLERYTLISRDSISFGEYVDDYPVLTDEPVYVRNAVEEEMLVRLDPVMGRAFLIVSAFESLERMPSAPDIPASVNERIAAMDEGMIVQAAAEPVRAEYAALGIDVGKLQVRYILRTGFVMLLLSLLSGACAITVGFLAAKTGAGLARNLRKSLFEKVESFSNAEFDRFSTASLITRTTNDVTQIQMVVIMMIRMVFYAPIIGVGAVIRALGKASSMWWVILAAVGILMVLVLSVYKIAVPKFKLIQNLIDRLNLVSRENLSGMMVVRAFNRQGYEERRFDKANKDLTDTSLFVNRVMVVMMPLMMLIMNGLSILIIWVGAHKVAQSAMQVGDMMAFLQYTMQIVFAFLMLSMMFIFLPRASVSGERIADVLASRASIRDPKNPKLFDREFQGLIEFKNVSFRYPGAEEDVLHDISFTARPGETTAFIGSTGSGKSTIVNLIPRFYDVTEGSILLDGADIREVAQHDLRDKIGFVPQRSILFSGTVETNLRYADERADDELLRSAVNTAQAEEFISSNPEGMASEISQGGANVSGGQKQRLSIARALVKKAPIYVFDDSFSSLDFKTEAALRRALRKSTEASTLLIVTQRVSTIKNADQIIVLEEGRIAGKGTHHELIETCETYREIALSQLSSEELA